MHDCLRPRNILRLPLSLRRIATAAADGSVNDLRALCYEIERIPANQAILFLPAFYANLDPARIPDTDVEDENLKAEDIERCFVSLDGIYGSQNLIPAHAFLDIWPRYWPWFRFFHEQMIRNPEHTELTLCRKLVVLIARVSRTPAVAQFVAETPGVRSVFARTWWLLHRAEITVVRDNDFDCLIIGCIVGAADASEPFGLGEFVDGAGGDIHDLASLVLQTISEFVPDLTTPSALVAKILFGALKFVITTDHIHDKNWDANTRALSIALREIGFARALTIVIHNLADATSRDANHVVHESFTLLGSILLGKGSNAHLGHRCISEALRGGLLQAMLICGYQPPESTAHAHLKFFLEAILSMSLMYHTVVRGIEVTLSDLEDAVNRAPLANTEMWQDFLDLARERVAILKSMEASDLARTTACDNLECRSIDARPNFERCSGCKSTYYCSKQCQISDWRHGGHRRICAPGLLLPLTEYQDLTQRDRAFIRTIVHHDYEALKADIVHAQVLFMNQFPREGFMTMFDYTWGRPSIKVLSVVNSPESKHFKAQLGAEWVTAVSRALRSEGRMELHLVQVVVSADPKFWLIPLRTNTPSLRTGIKQLANSLPPGIGDPDRPEAFSSQLLADIVLLIDKEEKAGLQAVH
ncbi:hypothetical protein C8R47DRAFT_1315648 [Mycena vitilis]|nr:hypothetical protein C8R47DRAFT_1315648 [Mycena vitilis]